jgi:hypothetical protein
MTRAPLTPPKMSKVHHPLGDGHEGKSVQEQIIGVLREQEVGALATGAAADLKPFFARRRSLIWFTTMPSA